MINFVEVTKVFNPDKVALDRVTFDIEAGEFVFVTGHSGCGKTTLLRLFLRELQPTEGKIYFDEQELSTLSRRKVAQLRRKIGVVFQDYKLLNDLTVWENIALPLIIAHQSKTEIDNRIEELLKMLKLEGREQYFPAQLSGGEAQRVSLARALSMAPKVIFADEPTGNLDEDNSETIYNLLKAINKYGTTVVFATHNLSFIKRMPQARHLKFDEGRLVSDSKTEKTIKATLTGEKPAEGKEMLEHLAPETKVTRMTKITVEENIEDLDESDSRKEEARIESEREQAQENEEREKTSTAEKGEGFLEEDEKKMEEIAAEEDEENMGEKSEEENVKVKTKSHWGFFANKKREQQEETTIQTNQNKEDLTARKEIIDESENEADDKKAVVAAKEERKSEDEKKSFFSRLTKKSQSSEKEVKKATESAPKKISLTDEKDEEELLKKIREEQRGFKRRSKIKLDKIEMKTEEE